MSVEIKEIEYENYGKCLQISNGLIDVAVTINFGPRIVRFGFTEGPNVLYNDLERKYTVQNEKTTERFGKDAFTFYGGHRIWLSPEKMPDTYYPDNEPVVYGILPEGVTFTPPHQKQNDMQLSFEIIMSEGTTDIMVVHSAKNSSKEKHACSLWAITMLNGGGTEILPLNTDNSNATAPNRTISLWPGTDFHDERLSFGSRFMTVRHDKNNEKPLKIGLNNPLGWACYANGDTALIKRYVHTPSAPYPDYGCSSETYMCKDFLEMQTVSPLYSLDPGEGIRHVENLFLIKKPAEFDPSNEDSVTKYIQELNL